MGAGMVWGGYLEGNSKELRQLGTRCNARELAELLGLLGSAPLHAAHICAKELNCECCAI
jgi:hypothetical protein